MAKRHVIIYEHFYNKGYDLYKTYEHNAGDDRTSVHFHKISPPQPLAPGNDPPPETRPHTKSPEDKLLDLHHTYDARVLILNTQPLSDAFFKQLKPQSLLIRYGVGYDNIPLQLCRELKIFTAYTPECITQATAELTIAAMFALARGLLHHHTNVLAGKWDVTKSAKWQELPPAFQHIQIAGKKLSIIGYGRIGKKVADLCANAFNMPVTVWTRQTKIATLTENAKQQGQKNITFTADLKTALGSADIISVHLSLNEQTRNLLNAKSLAWIPQNAFLINTARGKIIDEEVLYERLSSHKLRAAALDVFSQEPAHHFKKLAQLPHVLLTPHQGGNTQSAHSASAKVILENIMAYYDQCFDQLTLIPNSFTTTTH